MVEIKISEVKADIDAFRDLLEKLQIVAAVKLNERVQIKYSGEQTGPMAPVPYYYLSVDRSRKIGPIELEKKERRLCFIYFGIFGRSRGKTDMFCSLSERSIEDVFLQELEKYGEKQGIDTIYVTENFSRPIE